MIGEIIPESCIHLCEEPSFEIQDRILRGVLKRDGRLAGAPPPLFITVPLSLVPAGLEHRNTRLRWRQPDGRHQIASLAEVFADQRNWVRTAEQK